MKKYLYISSVDISLSNGPGVNEREFIFTLYKLLDNNIRFIIPEPEMGLPDSLPKELFNFTYPHNQRTPWRWIIHQLSTYRAFKKLIQGFRPGLLIIRSPIFAFSYLLITKRYGIPYVLKSEGVGKLEVFKRKNSFWESLAGINRAIHRRLLSDALLLDTVNEKNIDRFKELTGKSANMVWIDNAVNTDRFKPESTEKARKKIGITHLNPLIGYVGNYPWSRGGMQIIEALPHLIKKYPNIGVLILGGGDGLALLKNKAKELNVEEKCILTGQVPFKNVPDYVNAIDLGVSISNQAKFKMASEQKVRQYLACSKPIVVSPGGSEYIANKGLGSVVEPDNIKQIADELDRWLSLSKIDRENFSKKARQYAIENLSFNESVNKRLNLWNRAFSKTIE